jgi:hypothetical protein
VAGVLHGAFPGPVWPVGKLSLGLDQFQWPTSVAIYRNARELILAKAAKSYLLIYRCRAIASKL